MRTALIGVLAVAAVLMIWLVLEIGINGKLTDQVRKLDVQIAANTKTNLIAMREKCAAQAERKFHALGYNENASGMDSAIYANHYNPRLEKCFLAIESTSYSNGHQFTNRFLLDAYEQREFAEYTWMSSDTKKYWDVPPMVCKLMPNSNDERMCKSEDEYKAFVARYME